MFFMQKNVLISNQLGLHARASAKLTQLAAKFKSDVFIIKNQQKVNAKSIMGVMMLAASCGTEITIEANGEDEHQAIDAITQLFNDKFGEGK
jgi:phosphocarrier protein HPr